MGFDVAKKLSDYWKLEEHKLGETTFTHFADGTAHKNRMQGNDYVTSQMYAHGITCFTCHDVHGTEHPAQSAETRAAVCASTATAQTRRTAPRADARSSTRITSRTAPAVECIACHMPKIATDDSAT